MTQYLDVIQQFFKTSDTKVIFSDRILLCRVRDVLICLSKSPQDILRNFYWTVIFRINLDRLCMVGMHTAIVEMIPSNINNTDKFMFIGTGL